TGTRRNPSPRQLAFVSLGAASRDGLCPNGWLGRVRVGSLGATENPSHPAVRRGGRGISPGGAPRSFEPGGAPTGGPDVPRRRPESRRGELDRPEPLAGHREVHASTVLIAGRD